MNKTLSMIVGSLLMIPALGQAAENHKPVSGRVKIFLPQIPHSNPQWLALPRR